jgi:dephospho-CoA kinase
MLIVALTGGIATGKSVVADVWKYLGCYLHNSDKTAHLLMSPGKPAWKEIIRHFGSSILNPDETINRKILGQIVFSDIKERLYLNHLLHPLVLKEKEKIINQLIQEKKYSIFVSEAALTIETGYTDFFDRTVVVFCKPVIQIQRLMEREGINMKAAKRRIESQMPQQEKIKHADYTIDTSTSFSSTIEQAEQVYRYLKMDESLKI